MPEFSCVVQLNAEELMFIYDVLRRFGCNPKQLKRLRRFIGNDVADMISGLMNRLVVQIKNYEDFIKKQELSSE